jgi:alpha-glucosidase (family GH31 glycosyl hydrolase)
MKIATWSAMALALAVVSVSWGAKPSTPPSNTYVLESDTLRLEVSGTYGYRLIEKGTNALLLTQNQTTFTLGSSTVAATAISGVTIGNVAGIPTLTGTLNLDRRTTAHVTFSFQSADNLQVNLRSNSGTPLAVSERFADAGERYYGVWENALPTALDNRGISAAYNGKETTTTREVFAASARAPFYVTNKNYGIYTQTEAAGTYTFASSGNTSFKFSAPTLQYNILHGTTPKAILAHHNTVAGPAFMPPDWAFSTIFWRDDFHQLPANPAISNAQGLILDDAAKLQGAQIHAGAMWIDRPYGTGSATQNANVAGWGNMDFDASFPDPSAMAQTLHNGGINLMLWIANKANNQLKTEGAANGYLFNVTNSAPGIDLRNAGAYDWFGDKLDVLNHAALVDGDAGIKGYKIDRGGEGEIPDALINAETTLLQKLAFERLQAEHGTDFFSFTRNINGEGRRYAAVWSGDPQKTWGGFQSTIKNGLRSGIINFPMWGSDTGGYAGTTPFSQELFSRWIAFSAFSPMMEILQGPGRNIFYDFSAQTFAITKKYTDLHHDLIPYTRSSLATALQNGTPIMRAMFLEFPGNAAVADTWDQYMYGPNILVAPVTVQGAVSRSVYLPSLAGGGKWLDYNDRKTVHAGGQAITAAAAIDVIPMYVREGAIIPRGDIVKGNNQWTADWQAKLRIEVFPSAKFASYFEYFTGAGMTTISAVPLLNGFEISAGDLLLPGVFDVYLTQPSEVWLNDTLLLAGTGYTFDEVNNLLQVPLGLGPLTLDIFGSGSLFGSGFSFAGMAAVPEPATAGIAALAMVGLLVRRRRL